MLGLISFQETAAVFTTVQRDLAHVGQDAGGGGRHPGASWEQGRTARVLQPMRRGYLLH